MLRDSHRPSRTSGERIGPGGKECFSTYGQIIAGHAIQWRVPVGVHTLNVSPTRDEERRGVLIFSAHTARVQRQRASRSHIVDKVRVGVKELR